VIHFVTWLPLPYQQTLCQVLSDHYGANFVVWFGETKHEQFPYQRSLDEGFPSHYLDQEGYRAFFKALSADREEAVVILGGWRSPMSGRVLLITSLLRIPVFIWADHPVPRRRGIFNRATRSAYLSFLNRIAAGFLACGEPTLRYLQSLGLNPEKLLVFPYWTSLPADWQLPPANRDVGSESHRQLRLITIGRLIPLKQFDVAIKAIAIANQSAGYRIAELVIVGDGPERSLLEKQVQDLNLSDCVTFLGWLEGDEVRREIRQADVLTITSEFEPYGVVVLEAMAAGRPILASNQVMAAVDRDEGNGAVLLHPVGDARHLAEQICWLASDQNRLNEASRAARSTAEKWPPERAIEILDEALFSTNVQFSDSYIRELN